MYIIQLYDNNIFKHFKFGNYLYLKGGIYTKTGLIRDQDNINIQK